MDFLAQITAQLQANNVRQELQELCKNRDVNVRLKVNDHELQNALNDSLVANSFSKTGNKIGNQIGQNIGKNISKGVKNTVNGKSVIDTIFKKSDLKNNAYMTKVSNSINKQMDEIQKMSNAKGWKSFEVTGTEMADGYIKSLRLMVTEANGTVKELNFIRAKIEGKNKVRNSLVQIDDVKVLKTARESELKIIDDIAKAGEKQHKQDINNEKKYQHDLAKEREKGIKQAKQIAEQREKEEREIDARWQNHIQEQKRQQRKQEEDEEYSFNLAKAYDEADANVAREKAEREAIEKERKRGQEQAKQIAEKEKQREKEEKSYNNIVNKQLSNIASDYIDGTMQSTFKQMSKSFDDVKKFEFNSNGILQVDSIYDAKNALKEFENAYESIDKHFSGEKILDDSTLISTFEKMETASDKFKNSMSDAKIDIQPFLQIEKSLNNASNKLDFQKFNLQNIENDASQISSDKYGNTKSYQLMISYIDQAKAKQLSLNQEISKGADADFNKINSELREMNSLVSKAKTQYDKLEQPISEIEAQTASSKTLSWLKENSKAAKEFGDRLKEIANKQSLAETAGELENLNKEFAKIKSQARQKGLTGLSGFDEISRATKRIAEFTGIYAILENVITDIPKQMIDAVIKVDDAMTNLRMATSVTNNEAKELMKTYSELGKELKTLGTDVATSATEWLKQGKSISEASALAKDSIVLSKISGMSSEDSTKTITAAMKSYELSASEVMGFIDQISSIDMASATDVQGLSNAFNEVAANARQAGVETEKLLSYAAVIGETTQEGMAGVGTALNAIFSRMGNIKLSRLKDFETGEDLSNVETVLRKVGISLRDGEGQFRQFDEVLDETASKFNSFSSVTQRAVANAFAGTHHANSFMVLMQNYPKVQEYVTIAMNSSGESMKKFEAYTDSATGKIEGFKNAFQTLSNTIVNSDLFKGIIDSGTFLLNLLESIIDTIGVLPVVFAGFNIGKLIKTKSIGNSNENFALYGCESIVA